MTGGTWAGIHIGLSASQGPLSSALPSFSGTRAHPSGNSQVLKIWPRMWETRAFPGVSVGKDSTCQAGDSGLIPGLGRSPGAGHGNPLQYSCLENPHGQRSLVGYRPWDHEESDTIEATKCMGTKETEARRKVKKWDKDVICITEGAGT